MPKQDRKKVKLGDIMISNPKITLKKGEVYDFVEMQSVKEGCYKSVANVDRKAYKGGTKFQNGDTIFARITPCLQNGKISKVQGIDIGFGSTEYFVFRNIEGVTDSDYLFYLLITEDVRKIAEKSMVGASGRQRANIKSIEDYPISLPPLPTQQRIANILSKYDDLIENNTRRIKILEGQAQLIYNEWFVKFKFPGYEDVKMIDSDSEFGEIPEGWEVKKVGDDVLIKKGKNITKNTIVEGNIPVVAGGLAPAYYHNKPNVSGPVITISASGANSGYVNIYYQDIWASDCGYISKEETNKVYFYYTQLKFRQNDLTHLQRGAAQPHVYPKDLMNISMVWSNIGLEDKFEKIVTPIYEEIGNLQKQNQNLKETRDMLIPKLVSGEVEV